MLNTILTLCVLIECWHMFYYGIFFDKFAHTRKIMDWAMKYKSMTKSFLEFAREYTKEENKDLRASIGGAKPTVMQLLEQIETMGGMSGASKILKTLPPKDIYFLLGQMAIEIIYWIFTVILLIMLPLPGMCLVVLIYILSLLQSKYNKNDDVGLHIFDSVMCIAIFVMISSMY